MAKRIDITGQRFGMLTALEVVGKDNKNNYIWKFKCDCGNFVEYPIHKVRRKDPVKSCGCLNAKGKPKVDITGNKFNKLTVIKYSRTVGRRRTMWLCKCDCGQMVEVEGSHLKNGHTKSCGCLNREFIADLNFKNGLSGTKIYYVWYNMRNRCNRKDGREYSLYGGRGISVCDEWLGENGFVNFSNWAMTNGYSDNLSLDRIDNNKGYCPENCRWTDRYIQANNKRNNRFVKINGEVGTVANMARKYKINYWNLLHYSKGVKNYKYPDLRIEVADESEIQEYRKSESYRKEK